MKFVVYRGKILIIHGIHKFVLNRYTDETPLTVMDEGIIIHEFDEYITSNLILSSFKHEVIPHSKIKTHSIELNPISWTQLVGFSSRCRSDIRLKLMCSNTWNKTFDIRIIDFIGKY